MDTSTPCRPAINGLEIARLAASAALSLLILCLWATAMFAQTDTIGGIVNRYTRVTFIECTNNSAINVADPYGFKPGDRILIIQMQGADVVTANDSTFGSITNYNNCGNYELATIDEINGYTFVLHYELARTYTLSGIVQVVRVPTYTNVVIGDTLRAKSWDGSTGGVLALIASDTVTMHADMDVSGAGFRSGYQYGATFVGDIVDYRNSQKSYYSYPTVYVCGVPSDTASFKGEGVSQATAGRAGGRGFNANAGGGGNGIGGGGGSAGGGAGGGSYGRGGNGGIARDASGTAQTQYHGLGGDSVGYSNALQRVYMGGSGGWGGLDELGKKGPGSAGGGIAIIRANTVIGNSHSIRADGDTSIGVSLATVKPSGGGGAGGAIVLDVQHYDSDVTASVQGAPGQNASICNASGGGGGGGCVWLAGSSATPANLTIQKNGGVGGTEGGCDPVRDGNPGANGGVLTNLQIPEGTTPR